MLIYNHKQEFIGIDDKDLKSIGYKNLQEMQNECKDFADLFVKRPNYIHNFKNFSWIYFVLNSDFPEAKVIISAKGREFSATLEINTFYLSDSADQESYVITLTKLKALDGREIELSKKETPQQPAKKTVTEIQDELIPDLVGQSAVTLSEPEPLDIPPSTTVVQDPYDFDFSAPLEIEDVFVPLDDTDRSSLILETYEEPVQPPVEEISVKKEVKTKPMLGDYTSTPLSTNEYINNLQTRKDYVYDPKIASEELGLPVDLIEEFIGDFIQQSYDFKTELYNHLANEEISDVKLLSHKLKGVAANLRIEDAFEVLSVINTSSDLKEIRATLDYFYNIIAKLNKEETPSHPSMQTVPVQKPVQTPVQSDDDIFPFPDLEIEEKVSTPVEEPLHEEIYDFDEKSLIQEYTPPSDTLEYDRSTAVNELGLPVELIDELLQDFKEQADNVMPDIETAVSTMNKELLKPLVMNIKGTADNLRISKISQILGNLLSSTNEQESQELLVRLRNYINQL